MIATQKKEREPEYETMDINLYLCCLIRIKSKRLILVFKENSQLSLSLLSYVSKVVLTYSLDGYADDVPHALLLL